MNYFNFYSDEKFSLKYILHQMQRSENFVHNHFSIIIIKGSTQYSSKRIIKRGKIPSIPYAVSKSV